MTWQRLTLMLVAAVMMLALFVKGRHRGEHPPVSAFRASSPPARWLQVTGDVRFQGVYSLADINMTNAVTEMTKSLCAVKYDQLLLENLLERQGGASLAIVCPPGSAAGLATIRRLPVQHSLVLLGSLPLNSATADELTLVPGIGPVLAHRVVQHRQKYGEFEGVEELLQVEGIAEKKLEILRRYLTI